MLQVCDPRASGRGSEIVPDLIRNQPPRLLPVHGMGWCYVPLNYLVNLILGRHMSFRVTVTEWRRLLQDRLESMCLDAFALILILTVLCGGHNTRKEASEAFS